MTRLLFGVPSAKDFQVEANASSMKHLPICPTRCPTKFWHELSVYFPNLPAEVVPSWEVSFELHTHVLLFLSREL